MVSKSLHLREDVYRKLSEAEKEGESFSYTIDRLLEKRGHLLSRWGVRSHMAEVEPSIRNTRKRAVVRQR